MDYEQEIWDYYQKIGKILKKHKEAKNYKELCNILKEPIKAGDSKIAQINYWNNFFTYVKIGHSFKKITLKTPEEITEYIQNKIADDVLMYLFYNLMEEYYSTYPGILAITNTELACLLGFINDSFSEKLNSKPMLAYDLENYLLSINDNNSKTFLKKKQKEIESFRVEKDFKDKNVPDELDKFQEKINLSGKSWLVNSFSTYKTSFTVEDFMQHTFLSYYRRVNNLIDRVIAQNEKMVDKILFGVFRKLKDNWEELPKKERYIYYTRELSGEEKRKYAEIQTEVFQKYEIQSMKEAYTHSISKSVITNINTRTLREMEMLNSFSVYFFSSSPLTATFNKENFENQLVKNNSNFILSVNNAKGKRLLQYKRVSRTSAFNYRSYDNLPDGSKEEYQIASYLYEILSEKLLRLDIDENNALTNLIFQKSLQRYKSHNAIVLKEKEILEKEAQEKFLQES